MYKKYISMLSLAIILSITLISTGCESEGPAEKAGEQIDQTIEKGKDAVEDAADEITGTGPAEETGEAIDEAVEETEESMEEAEESVKESMEEAEESAEESMEEAEESVESAN